MRYRPRTDHNQAEIVRILREKGCLIFDLSTVGQGCPDLLGLTPAQEKAIQAGWPIHVVRSPEEALALVDSTKKVLPRD